MGNVAPGLLLALLGALLVVLGRWGRVHAESLVSVALPEKRRVKELRSVRRGVRSVLLLGGVLAVNGAVLVVVGAVNAKS